MNAIITYLKERRKQVLQMGVRLVKGSCWHREGDGKFGWLQVNGSSILLRLNLKWQRLLFGIFSIFSHCPCAYHLFINRQFNPVK